MGQKTSIYLSDELAARVEASGLPLAELVRRGLDQDREHIDQTIRDAIREELAGIAGPGNG